MTNIITVRLVEITIIVSSVVIIALTYLLTYIHKYLLPNYSHFSETNISIIFILHIKTSSLTRFYHALYPLRLRLCF